MTNAEDGSLAALVVDYGGVLTNPLRVSTGQWLTADGIDPDSFTSAMRDWLGRGAAPGTPVHQLETGELPTEEFERQLAARLVAVNGTRVSATGLLRRLFAGMRPDPAMLNLVRDARAAGLRTALLSNSWGNSYPLSTLDELFDVVVISGEIGLRKPDQRIYRHLLDRLKLPAARCLFVDDFAVNVEGAMTAGLRALRHVDAATTRRALTELVPTMEQVNR